MDPKTGFDDFLPAIFLGMLSLILGFLAWRWVHRSLTQNSPEGKGIGAKLGSHLQIPGYLGILSVAFILAIYLCPQFAQKGAWMKGAQLFASLALAFIIGEGSFALGVDYYLRERRNTEVPSIFEQLLKAIIYCIVVLSFLSTTYRVDITPLLTTSAVFTMVIGLALQDVLGNLFSGISVHISPPFRIGDVIKVSGFFGKVTESNWRATSIKLYSSELVILPNNDIAKKEIVNLSQFPGAIYSEIHVGLPYATSPEKARTGLLDACSQVGDILKSPPPRVFMTEYQDSSINYRIKFWHNDNLDPSIIKDQLMSRVWYRLKRSGIDIPFPIREIFTHPEKDEKGVLIERRLRLLSEVDFLSQLERPLRAFLAANLKEYWFDQGEVIVEKGSRGTEFFLIDSGEVSVYLEGKAGPAIANLVSGQFFGEMALLTGEPRTAMVKAERETLLLAIDYDTMKALLQQNADIAETLSDVLAERSAKNVMAMKKSEESEQLADEERAENLEKKQNSMLLLERIKGFFRLA